MPKTLTERVTRMTTVALMAIAWSATSGAQAARATGAPAAHTAAAPIRLEGPVSGLALGPRYGYALWLTTTWRARSVRVVVSVPAAHYSLVRSDDYLPHKLLLVNFTVAYHSAALMSRGITVSISLPGARGKTILTRHYGLSLGPASQPVPSRPPGVYLAEANPSCPLTGVILNTNYSCVLDVVNGPTVYHGVFVRYIVHSSGFASKPITIGELSADSEVTVTVPVRYGTVPESHGSTAAVQLEVSYGAPVRPFLLYQTSWGVTLAAGQEWTPAGTPTESS